MLSGPDTRYSRLWKDFREAQVTYCALAPDCMALLEPLELDLVPSGRRLPSSPFATLLPVEAVWLSLSLLLTFSRARTFSSDFHLTPGSEIHSMPPIMWDH